MLKDNSRLDDTWYASHQEHDYWDQGNMKVASTRTKYQNIILLIIITDVIT